ncbi:SMP-30/gluconolactonase/LRE family protein [Flavobacterium aestivum]|uniref:SMP-30/gluconolactonase/LRE family protein n=1 Tax=Flavobacterium aestivum TaxID=3003257 RepID=UPI002285ADDA|nr:SMP-30/gluconolactonase/LRE family protein [Flavobacterium aestivum]
MKNFITFLILLILFGCNTKTHREYILDEKDLVPEGIAYSKTKDVFYLTSIAKSKIVEIDRKTGKQIDFIKEHEFGYSPGVGVYVDDERNLLHAIGGYYMLKDSLTSLFTFDLNTKKLLKRYDLAGEHFLNDMVKDKKGNIYLTDTKGSALFVLKHGNNFLELFYKSPEIESPNGIAISDDNTKLYIASGTKGVRILNISTKKILNQKDKLLEMSQGIDGLEFYKNHLYAIQNGVGANTDNFRKLILNHAQDQIIDVKVIDSHTPRLNVPLTFCLAEDKAIVIGNSNLQYLNQENLKFTDADTILKTKLLEYTIE